ncbi:MAG: DNA mismatch repair protein MutS, partial [Asticcacaulis sp.]
LFGDPELSDALKQSGGLVQPMVPSLSEPEAARRRLERLYGVATLDGYGQFSVAEVAALGLLAAYIETTQAGSAPALKPPRRFAGQAWLSIDAATRASLEIDRSQSGGRDGSLLAALDMTLTPGGARLLAARLTRPLLDLVEIRARQAAIGLFVANRSLRRDVREGLKASGDMARALSRLALGRGGPRDLAVLRDGLRAGAELGGLIASRGGPLGTLPTAIEACLDALNPGRDVRDFLEALDRGLEAEPPLAVRDGGFIRPGFRADLDETRSLRDDSRRVIVAMEAELQAESGVSLKIRHNAVLGYFVEATAKQAEPLMQAPLNTLFIHRQTLANQVRFTTAALAELDARIAQAGSRAMAMELDSFEAFRAQARVLAAPLQAAADALAQLDVASAAAEWAEAHQAVCPEIDDSLVFVAEAARHPVVEAAVKASGGVYTPNGCVLDGQGLAGARLSLVTGPNMAGKSTFLRQNALLVVMAQAGLYVPAASLRLGLVDRLFSRVGAGDDLARGRSTFMMEMVETAAILTQATPRSFVVLDEIGRGTATYDGLAIAWACAEALHDVNQARTLFATHYHELATLETRLDYVSNLSMRAKEWNGELVFLHEARSGAADRSYGVQVARLAGVPVRVVNRAKAVLERLEAEGTAPARLEDLPLFAAFAAQVTPSEPAAPSKVETLLAGIDPDSLSPREALEALYSLKAALKPAAP